MDYPNFGLPFPITLDDIMNDPVFEKISWMPIAEQAKFADGVCKANAKDVGFCFKQTGAFERNPQYDVWNSTSIGNLAYMALYSCPEYRDRYSTMHEKAMIHFRNRFPQKSTATASDTCTIQ